MRPRRAHPTLCLLCAVVVLPAFAKAAPGPRMPLMKAWKVKPVQALAELGKTFHRADFDDSAWQTVDIRTTENPFLARYVLYRKWVAVPADWAGKPISIVFEGVDDDAVVYVNGKKVGTHKGWNTAFAFDLAKVVRCGEKNLIAVVADNSGGGGAGIWRPVSLVLTEELARAETERQAAVRKELKAIPYRIVFETRRDDNWELFIADADGSNPANLTRTRDLDELYPHVSPDGTKIAFVVDSGKGQDMLRSVCYMNLDGTGRTKVADHGRQPCWSPDGTTLAYLGSEFKRFRYHDFATKGIFFHDIETGKTRPHPNDKIHHLYNPCYSPDGKWIVATVHGGMGFKHGILAIEADGQKVHNLGIPGCRPDISPDGKLVAWGPSDWALRVGELDFSGPKPRVVNPRDIVTSAKPMKIYHVDWSPDGRHIAFSRGPSRKTLGFVPEIVGIPAQDWDLCVADAAKTNHWASITSDGASNKEPDWVPRRPEPKR